MIVGRVFVLNAAYLGFILGTTYGYIFQVPLGMIPVTQ